MGYKSVWHELLKKSLFSFSFKSLKIHISGHHNLRNLKIFQLRYIILRIQRYFN
jgi:hypothetical protein